MEIKIFEKDLIVGKKDYIKLHKDILKCKSLIDIKLKFAKFNGKYNLTKNSFHQGISIYDNYIYIIKNIKNDKRYVGQTTNLVSRMHAYITLSIHNKELKKDIIDLGYLNFQIEFIKSESLDIDENNNIQRYIDNCYNISLTNKIRQRKPLKRIYKLGNYEFKSKKEIREFCRFTIDSFNVDENIDLNSEVGIFAIDMIKKHYNYDGFLSHCKNIKLSITMDDQNDARGVGNYKIFCFEYFDNRNKHIRWGFSTNKIIERL